jgi:multimeric flavodoxin WrbA
MKALILNGSLEHQTCLMPIQDILESELSSAGWECESLLLHRFKVGTCIGCFKCWDTTPGICFQDDQGREITKKAINCDLLVFLTPLTWGGYSSELKKAIERMLGLLHPSFVKIKDSYRHKKRYETYPSVLGIAVAQGERDSECEQIFKTLIARHSLNWHTPAQRAEVFRDKNDDEQIQKSIKSMLAELGEKK